MELAKRPLLLLCASPFFLKVHGKDVSGWLSTLSYPCLSERMPADEHFLKVDNTCVPLLLLKLRWLSRLTCHSLGAAFIGVICAAM